MVSASDKYRPKERTQWTLPKPGLRQYFYLQSTTGNFNFNFILPKVNTDYIRQAQVMNIDNLRLKIYLWKFYEKHKITWIHRKKKPVLLYLPIHTSGSLSVVRPCQIGILLSVNSSLTNLGTYSQQEGPEGPGSLTWGKGQRSQSQ